MPILRMFGPAVLLTLLLLPLEALAQGIISDTASQVAGPLQQSFGGGCSGPDCAVTLVDYVILRIQLIITTIAAYVIVRNGITMVYSSVEEEQTKAKKAIGTGMAGLMLTYLSPRFVVAFYTAGGEEGIASSEGAAIAGASVLADEVFGVIRWMLGLYAILCMIVLIYSAIGTLIQPPEQGETKLKSALISIAMASILLAAEEAVKATFGLSDFSPPGAPTPNPIIIRVAQILQTLVGMSGVFAIAIFVYACITMLLNMGNEEEFRKAKSLIIRVGVALVLILISYMIASFIVMLLGG